MVRQTVPKHQWNMPRSDQPQEFLADIGTGSKGHVSRSVHDPIDTLTIDSYGGPSTTKFEKSTTTRMQSRRPCFG